MRLVDLLRDASPLRMLTWLAALAALMVGRRHRRCAGFSDPADHHRGALSRAADRRGGAHPGGAHAGVARPADHRRERGRRIRAASGSAGRARGRDGTTLSSAIPARMSSRGALCVCPTTCSTIRAGALLTKQSADHHHPTGVPAAI